MDWKLLGLAGKILIVLLFIMLGWGLINAIKAKNKFAAFVLFVLMVAEGLAIYAMFGLDFFSF